MANIFTAIFGTKNGRELKRMGKIVSRINELEAEMDASTDLLAKTAEFKSRLNDGETLDQLLPEAFAAVREAAKRIRLVPVGSLGIVAKAYHMRTISMTDAQHYILNLYEVSSLFVTKVIVEMAIDRLRNPASS